MTKEMKRNETISSCFRLRRQRLVGSGGATVVAHIFHIFNNNNNNSNITKPDENTRSGKGEEGKLQKQQLVNSTRQSTTHDEDFVG